MFLQINLVYAFFIYVYATLFSAEVNTDLSYLIYRKSYIKSIHMVGGALIDCFLISVYNL